MSSGFSWKKVRISFNAPRQFPEVENLIGKQIKKLRLKNDLTQEKLSIKAGVPYTTLTKIESGVIKKPSFQIIVQIAKALDTKIDNLIK